MLGSLSLIAPGFTNQEPSTLWVWILLGCLVLAGTFLWAAKRYAEDEDG